MSRKEFVAPSRAIVSERQIDDGMKDESRFGALVTATSQVVYAMSADWSRMLWLRGGGFLRDSPQPSAIWLKKYIHPDDQKEVMGRIRKAVRRGKIFELEHRVLKADGSIGWVHSRAVPIHNANGKTQEWFGAASDVTERKAMEARLLDSERRLALALRAAHSAVWELDVATRKILPADDLLYTMLGYAPGVPDTLEGWVALIHEQDRPGIIQLLEDVIQGARDSYPGVELRYKARDESWRWILCQAVAAERNRDGTATRLVGTHTDIHDRKMAAVREKEAAQHDPLTQLPNRALIYQYAEHLLAGVRRNKGNAAFLFVDLDRFKPINDTYGHSVGDALLSGVARRLTECLRNEDLVGRIGGDEFLVLLAHVGGEDDAAKVARHILLEVGKPYIAGEVSLHISPSIGISIYPQHGGTVDQLIRHADAAMYQTKASGRNDFQFFRLDSSSRVTAALRMESRLHEGLEAKEFELYFQPIVELPSNRVIGAEALMRWPAMQADPEEFIPVAEAAGFMPALGNWALLEACRQRRIWQDGGLPPIAMAVNVSPTQFRQKDFVGNVRKALVETGLPSRDLKLEITESTAMQNIDEVVRVLGALRDMGITVALDDFGTGYSSLAYLTRLPIDILKLDQSFVHNLAKDSTCQAIADGILALAKSVGLAVVAEGVESVEALNFLNERHCPQGQGFLFSAPLPGPEFFDWYQQQAIH